MEDILKKLPNNFLQKIEKIYPDRYEDVLATFLQKKAYTFRINWLKTDMSGLKAQMAREKVKASELDWPEGSFILRSDFRKFQNTSLYLDGLVYVQNLSSMVPVLVLDPQPEEEILDLCAAPGAKTTQIMSLTGGKARLTAVDKARPRFYKLLSNLKTQGADSVETCLMEGTMVRKKFAESFDKILVDAPCSVEARFYINNPLTYKYWKDQKVKEMRHKQKRLLAAACYAAKPGADIIYSTCTFSPEENEEVISWVLDKMEGEVELLPIELPLENILPGFRRWKGRKFVPELRRTVRIMPDALWEGFYIAHLKKI